MKNPDEILQALLSKSESERAAAIADAAQSGPALVPPASRLLASPDTESRRAGRRALHALVRSAGRDRTLGSAASVVEKALLASLANLQDPQARRDLIWLLSEIGNADTIQTLSGLLTMHEVREDARCALERIPGSVSLQALQRALDTVPADFQPAIAESLRKRGAKVAGHPSRRLLPVKPTAVQAVTTPT